MGRHHRQRTRRTGPVVILGTTILSAISPLGILLLPRPEPDQRTQALTQTETFPSLELPTLPPLDLRLDRAQPLAQQAKTTDQPKQPKQTKQTKTTEKPKPQLTPTVRPSRTAQPRKIATLETTTVRRVPTSSRTTTTTTQRAIQPTTSSTTSSQTALARTETSTPTTSRLVEVAKSYVGRNLPYRYGGDSLETGIDCSHFLWRVFKEAGYNVPYRSSSALAAWTQRVSDPQPGDLVLYSGHVGIYAGNGMMVHHGKPGGAFFVKVYKENFIGYGRIPV